MKSAIAISLLCFSAVGVAASQVAGTADHKFPPPPPPGYNPPSGGPGSPSSIKNLKDKIKTVVHILMENRSFDNLVGGQTSIPVDGPARNGPFCNPSNLSVPHSTLECTAPKDLDAIPNDPDHSVSGNNFEFYGTFHPNDALIQSGKLLPSQAGFVENQIRRYNLNDSFAGTEIMHFYTPEQVPVITAFCENFVTFDKWHSCVPGPTNPNRMCHLSGTSAGHGTNDNDFNIHAINTLSIFEQLTSQGTPWRNYDGTDGAFAPDAAFYNWTFTSGNTGNIVPLEQFFQDAMLGQLQPYSYINPSCCGKGTNSMHPTGPVSDGEVLLKQIYDVVRSSPQWQNMLLIVSFDESGGFFDHNPPPTAVRPDDLTYTETTPDGTNYTLTFDRYGGRIPQWIISPWVAKAHVEHLGTTSKGQTDVYSATSVLRTLGFLFDFNPFTARVEASPSFDHLITNSFREDAPLTMPLPHPF